MYPSTLSSLYSYAVFGVPMLQCLVDFTRGCRQQPKHKEGPDSVPHSSSSSVHSIASSTDWRDNKETWSFKEDYVSFPSLVETEDQTESLCS
ncbi:hypothetical protein PHYBLDRAFT_182356 [Phycomyces blakesleeanus NRRL 1555(-)]|uniref:Uncharacterized protein n=1 Tax=Phycomyces blakesleeanus (strain ATCC 8743b / DSM 1359 / FGSC 10004 / NBRC 33097 / NRRL 1555) TaxID=763407 RepID=A0A162WUB4_PHYB8|nr:hypothetical protein PHYBLDRAFT_182356 [Phycomyces blakesleeanus NRRL 1555(-)]OAD70905.1 hypothetical protein PHYBLDRAFT_182356 [Phycomyces blakesleeanus NRRL 1555(-)]|eukprot:XP_018288945.1 hypothetical protein PHYBLDRAFT_182356 [Phycomyces blakesleeanus NRRL 1555(-)]